jgi:serine---pyruvate transaminase
MQKIYLLAPGPTPLREDVSLEMAFPIRHHRTPQFSKIFGEAAEGVLIVGATGTSGDML